jgi:arylformamidase
MPLSLHLRFDGRSYTVDPHPIDLAIGLDFYGPQPSTYGVPPAWAAAFEGGGFVGDVRRGGGVNFETYHLTPHCNGTHTECVGHITTERLSVHRILTDSYCLAQVYSVAPVPGAQTTDTYDPPLRAGDRVITAEALAPLWKADWPVQALVLRTLPNDPTKRSRDYQAQGPPFFTLEAMQAIRAAGIAHLLVDFPSVDRLMDEGKLRNHRIFWGLQPGQQALGNGTIPPQTITEMIYVPDEVADGAYGLELQVAPFEADAAPSRPRLFRLTQT